MASTQIRFQRVTDLTHDLAKVYRTDTEKPEGPRARGRTWRLFAGLIPGGASSQDGQRIDASMAVSTDRL